MSDTKAQTQTNTNTENKKDQYFQDIANFILQHYEPANTFNYHQIIDIVKFFELFENLDDRPYMWQIEEGMKRAGFKNEETRDALYFLIKIPEKPNQNEHQNSNRDDNVRFIPQN